MSQFTSAMTEFDSSNQTRYAFVRNTLRAAIVNKKACDGLVLVEAPLASLFNTSRATVRRALEMLHEEALIRRFPGRGYIVDPNHRGPPPVRIPPTKEALGLDIVSDLSHGTTSSDRILDEVESDIINCLPFGTFRIVEQALADVHGVSRQVVREVLSRLRDRGLVVKNPQSHWIVGPLTARDLSDEYEVRQLLEPQALRESALKLSREELLSFIERLDQVGETSGPDSTVEIELDLHSRCLRHCRNRKLLSILRKNALPGAVNLVFVRIFGPEFDRQSFDEHRSIFEQLLRGSVDAAAAGLESHLDQSKRRSLQRLKTLSVFPEPLLPPYLMSV